eukprot:gnl/TRDRNA2_/TRDRNA2_40671_c0_seq2.p1 gnl/TRDRNA2_/TRDRNA2_40671_c0~~gnl/TRDRNA2_/TRDRNA2_40671_c0_seq2.p1  ORF type:complete len:224 (-),score=20.35 gnl/TRDRNA2_/TRDRNA2_40671_c0_seq2:6-677(-)
MSELGKPSTMLGLFCISVMALVPTTTAEPQARVQCHGPHALCTMASCSEASHDPITLTATMTCDCWFVNSTFAVSQDEILNSSVQSATRSSCTTAHPCQVNEAPVCSAIAEGSVFLGQRTAPGLVSAFSWEGWCSRVQHHTAKVCSASPWAACMTAPCSRHSESGKVSCTCPVTESQWIDFDGGGCSRYISTVPAGFDMRVIPGSEFALQACGDLPEVVTISI